MPDVDPSLIAVVDSLPRKHRKYLVEQQFARFILKGSNKRAKSEIVATRIGPRNINRYDSLYLSGNGLSFVWFFVPNVAVSLQDIAANLRRKHGARLVGEGLKPELNLDEDPKLHRMIDRKEQVVLQFGIRDRDRSVFRGWEYHAVESDHVYTVVLKSAPFTVEVRAPFEHIQEALMRALGDEIEGIDFASAQACALFSNELREKLEAELPSELFGSWDVGTGKGLGSSRLYSDDATPLREQEDFIEQSKHSHRKITHLEYRYYVTHPFDGYTERAEYGVNVRTGDMRVGPRTSEIALDHLRRNVVRIITEP